MPRREVTVHTYNNATLSTKITALQPDLLQRCSLFQGVLQGKGSGNTGKNDKKSKKAIRKTYETRRQLSQGKRNLKKNAL